MKRDFKTATDRQALCSKCGPVELPHRCEPVNDNKSNNYGLK